MWPIELIEILRVLTNDIEEPPEISENALRRVIMVAALQVTQELNLRNKYKVNVATERIIPDPTVEASRDEGFINMVALKAACIIDRGNAMQAANEAIKVVSGKHSFDLSDKVAGKLAILKQGWCSAYDQTKLEYLNYEATAVAGQFVMTPFRLYALHRHESRGR